jgi:hypothetical protein
MTPVLSNGDVMQAPDMAPVPGSRSLLGVVRLIGAVAIGLIATLAVLVVLDVLPDSVLSEFAMKILLVAAIAAAAIGVMSLLLHSRRG